MASDRKTGLDLMRAYVESCAQHIEHVLSGANSNDFDSERGMHECGLKMLVLSYFASNPTLDDGSKFTFRSEFKIGTKMYADLYLSCPTHDAEMLIELKYVRLGYLIDTDGRLESVRGKMKHNDRRVQAKRTELVRPKTAADMIDDGWSVRQTKERIITLSRLVTDAQDQVDGYARAMARTGTSRDRLFMTATMVGIVDKVHTAFKTLRVKAEYK